MKRAISFLIATLLLPAALPASAATLVPGDLIKASGPAVYYFSQEATRLVFPNERTYATWYANFDSVLTISDAELAAIQIGGNVTYRPGVRMVKITTDPKVYAIDGKMLRWITSEALATELYGSDWASKIDDVPDAFFVDYNLGDPITDASMYDPAAVMAAYPTIESLIATPEGITGSQPPEPQTPGFNLSIEANKTEAQANEQIELLAQTDYAGTITKMQIIIDGVVYKDCFSASFCTETWLVPTAGTKTSYPFVVKLFTANEGTFEASTNVTIVDIQFSNAIQLIPNSWQVKPNEPAGVRSRVDSTLNPDRNEIIIDGIVVEVCLEVDADDCYFYDYLSGPIGTEHVIYSKVKTMNNLWYKSDPIILTISDNDFPLITLTTGKAEMLPSETVDVTISASDDDGVAFVQILLNNVLQKECTGPGPCTAIVGPFENLMTGDQLEFSGLAVDTKGATSTMSGVIVNIK